MPDNRPWVPDVEMTSEIAARLIAKQFAAHAPGEIHLLGTGWDNSAYLADGQMLWRFPIRQLGAALIGTEMRVLGNIAPLLPLAIPSPVCCGTPAAGYPYPFAGYPFIPGVTACQIGWDAGRCLEIAPALARFLKTLHSIPVNPDWQLPGDTLRRTDLHLRIVQLEERLIKAAPTLEARGLNASHIAAIAKKLVDTPDSGRKRCVVHGDLYLRHLLVDTTSEASVRLTGIIDWGDVHCGDRSLDISIAYSLLSGEARRAFFEAYGAVDAVEHARARFRALHYGAILVVYGEDIGDDALVAAGEWALRAGSAD